MGIKLNKCFVARLRLIQKENVCELDEMYKYIRVKIKKNFLEKLLM